MNIQIMVNEWTEKKEVTCELCGLKDIVIKIEKDIWGSVADRMNEVKWQKRYIKPMWMATLEDDGLERFQIKYRILLKKIA